MKKSQLLVQNLFVSGNTLYQLLRPADILRSYWSGSLGRIDKQAFLATLNADPVCCTRQFESGDSCMFQPAAMFNMPCQCTMDACS